MKQLLSSNRGFTLIEVLLTVIIGTIVSSMIYLLFTTGLNLYQKIQIEGQLRDEADYVATMILNEMYSNSPESIETTADGIKLNRAGTKEIDSYLIEDTDKDKAEIDIYFKNGQFTIHTTKDSGSETTILDIPSAALLDELDGKKTEISLAPSSACTNKGDQRECTHGTLNVTMVIENNPRIQGSLIKTEPLVLESSFGF